jgi:lipopolysaccharide export LptBFGC system permease protein LptF
MAIEVDSAGMTPLRVGAAVYVLMVFLVLVFVAGFSVIAWCERRQVRLRGVPGRWLGRP